MRLVRTKIQNFRCYRQETAIDIDDLTVFIGKNDAGKSSILDALAIFFDEKGVPEADDVCVHTPGMDVRITCVFSDFPEELVLDATHSTDLKTEHLLNGDGLLEIVKTYRCTGSGKGTLKAVHARAMHPTAPSFDDLLSLTITGLRGRTNELGVSLDGVNQTISTELRQAIWNHADDLAISPIEVELKSEAAKAVWDQLRLHMPVFAIFKSDRASTDQDAEAQDPMNAAIQEALRMEEEQLSGISQRVEAKVKAIADRTVEKLAEMAPEVARELSPRVSTKKWESLFKCSLTGEESIPVNKRGSGTRRLILLNFFRAKAEQDASEQSARTIYAIEEPETSQHPANQQLLVDAFADLTLSGNCQILITTHTPVLARRFPAESLRFIEQEGGAPHVRLGTEEETLALIAKSLGVLADHDVKVFFGVEGPNDIAYLKAISRVLHDAGEHDIPDLDDAEKSNFLIFIPLGGSCLDLWLHRLRGLNRSEYYLFDRDNEPGQLGKYDDKAKVFNKCENTVAWTTSHRELENYIHPSIISSTVAAYEGVGDGAEDVPLLFAKAVHESSKSDVPWTAIEGDLKKLKDKVSRAKRRLNREIAQAMTPELLTEIDPSDEVRTWLRTIGAALEAV
jgi:putative ATP-dependent endonuclease of the OLD family